MVTVRPDYLLIQSVLVEAFVVRVQLLWLRISWFPRDALLVLVWIYRHLMSEKFKELFWAEFTVRLVLLHSLFSLQRDHLLLFARSRV